MSADEDPEADAMASLLAACDEALAERLLPPLAPGGVETPDQARLLKNLECLRLLRDTWPRHPGTPGADSPLAPERLGSFRITRELGRGGFGIVYLAFDPRLARPVALKVPRADILVTPHLRERFHHEARAAAALDHPNVVTVYETGEVDGVAYIASAYCPGPTLAQWLEASKTPVAFGEAADLVARIADGVAHAHAAGIVHRDLKPANVLLASAEPKTEEPNPISTVRSTLRTPGSAFQPKVTDFGLAKRLLAGDCGALTADGAVLGTPNYLAPEQVDPTLGPCGSAVDIYGLGAILYELLTCRPPFVSDSVMETLRQVGAADLLPPRRLRPQIPRDLETICLKCLEKDPRRRYVSAAALADDLRRFVRGEAVRARPLGPFGRARRWVVRRPTTAALVGLLAAAVLVGLIGVFVQWRRAEHYAERMRDERNTALQERDRAEATFRKSRELVDRLSRVGDVLANQPGFDDTRREVVEDVLAFHEDFLCERGDEPAFRLDAARAGIRVGQLRRELGQYDRAEVAFRHAAGLLDELLAERPDDKAVRFNRGRCAHFHAHLLRSTGRHAEGAAEYRRAAALFDALAAESPDDVGYRCALAGSLSNAAAADLAGGLTDRTDPDLARACRLQRDALAAAPRDAHRRNELAICLETLAVRHTADRPTEAVAHARESLDLYRGLVADYPTNTDYRGFLARTLATTARLVRRTDATEADRLLREGVAVARKLAADTPRTPVYQSALARALIELADSLPPADQSSEAGRLFREAAAVLRAVLRDHASSVENNELAWLIATSPDANLGTPAEALGCAERAVAGEPRNGAYWNTLAAVRYRCGDWKEALVALDKALEYRAYSPADGLLYALVYHRLGETEQARQHLSRASAALGRPSFGGTGRLQQEAARLLGDSRKN